MLVRELIEMLQNHDQDAEVAFEVPTGNYWRQVLAVSPTRVEQALSRYSEYNNGNVLIDPDDDNEERDTDNLIVLIG